MTIFNHRKTGKCAVFISGYHSDIQNQEDPCFFRIRSKEDLPDLDFCLTDVYIPALFADPNNRGYLGKEGLYHYLCSFFETEEERNDFYFLICPSGFPDRYVKGFGQWDMFGEFISKEKVLTFDIPIDIYRIVKSFVDLEKSAIHHPERFMALENHREAKKDYEDIFKPWYNELPSESKTEIDKLLPQIS